ncbi:hypothetical protein AAVH_04590 [Aphelenchoides avenae]|nr:hypothetical protein AAVH_04590 [Aphelenchus avenae]
MGFLGKKLAKDKDLELAAKIGKSLLEQNRELQERNEFLEESLIANNEAITQLQHQLKQRTSLLNAFTEYDNDDEGSVVDGSGERVGFVENLQKRVRQLEDENHKLREEATALKQQARTGEEREYERVNDYLSQLEKANVKISRLQAQLTEQSKECAEHAEEVERLVKEISKRKGHETMLSKENEGLAAQLGQYVKIHDELVSEMTELQERYLEVVGMLSETEEELRGHRQRVVPHR